jgi:hypothetical protein
MDENDTGGTKCSTDLNDHTPETKFCRQVKIVNLIYLLKQEYRTKEDKELKLEDKELKLEDMELKLEDMELKLEDIGKKMKSVITSNGITPTDVGPKELSELFDALKIDPTTDQFKKAITYISPKRFETLTGISDITIYSRVLLEAKGLVNGVIQHRGLNKTTTGESRLQSSSSNKTKTLKPKPKRRLRFGGKNKTIRKKTMKKRNKKRFSKKYKGGFDEGVFLIECLLYTCILIVTSPLWIPYLIGSYTVDAILAKFYPNLHGFYSVTFPDDEYKGVPFPLSYTGDFVKGIFHGRGTLKYRDGTVYEGDWVDGKKHGQGTMTYKNGNVDNGVWNNDVFVGGNID